MKPITLTICAFGSYGKKEIIDFRKPVQNLFLITGDTGSGKSTIFDAIVFALYGESSSKKNKKDGLELQSHFVDFGVEPYVELEFEENGETYIVKRSPRHQRLLKNGKLAATAVSETVSLTMPDGTEYPAKETNNKLKEIVGLTKDQFMQVAMIAQGEFMDVLRKSSDEKKPIFRKLFNTEVFADIVEVLNKKLTAQKIEMSKVKNSCQTIVSTTVIPSGCKDEDTLTNLKERIGNEDHLNSAVLELFLECLGNLIDDMEQNRETFGSKQKEVEAQYTKLNKEVAIANELKKRFEELQEANKVLAKCASQETEMNQMAILIQNIKTAYELKTAFDSYDKANQAYVDEQKKLIFWNEKLPEQTELYGKNQLTLELVTKEKEQNDARYNVLSERVEKTKTQFEKEEKLQQRLQQLEVEKTTLVEAARQAKSQLEQLEKDEIDWRNSEKSLAEAELRKQKLDHKVSNLDVLDQDYLRIQNNLTELDKQKEQLMKAQKAYIAAKDIYDQKNVEYSSKQSRFLDAQAGILASKLKKGCACPVCGSLEHPNPCVAETTDLSQEMLDVLAKEVSRRQKDSEEASIQANSLLTGMEEKQITVSQNIQKLEERIQSLMEKNVNASEGKTEDIGLKATRCKQVLDCIRTDIQNQLQETNAQLLQLVAVRKQLASAEQEKEILKRKSEDAQQKANEADKTHAGLVAEKNSLNESKDYATIEEANKVLFQANEKKKEVDNRYKTATEQFRMSNNAIEKCKTSIDQCEERIPGLKDNLEAAQLAYNQQLQECGKEQTWWEDVVSTNEKDTTLYESRIHEYQVLVETNTVIRKNALAAIDHQQLPDTEALMEELEQVNQQKVVVTQQMMELNSICQINQSAKNMLTKNLQENRKNMEVFGRLNTLYRTLNGNETGARMDIETYAQRYYLERILDAANVRFSEMSAGQFELRMFSIEKAGEGKNKGLDLMVYSHITGKEREVRTLSGGESFMAALALALGMADVIQEKSSSICLDMMFIDEGFGSLDDHSRSEAVKVLKAMAGGSKLIGIISHVTELKQEIDDQLVVKKDEKGSHSEWILS